MPNRPGLLKKPDFVTWRFESSREGGDNSPLSRTPTNHSPLRGSGFPRRKPDRNRAVCAKADAVGGPRQGCRTALTFPVPHHHHSGESRNDDHNRKGCRDRPPCLSDVGVNMIRGRPRSNFPLRESPTPLRSPFEGVCRVRHICLTWYTARSREGRKSGAHVCDPDECQTFTPEDAPLPACQRGKGPLLASFADLPPPILPASLPHRHGNATIAPGTVMEPTEGKR